MADFTMCRGEGCKKRRKCWRHTAMPNPDGRQSYFSHTPRGGYDCKYFMRSPVRR